jgi:drug/metabolite transporter (DMT)-like permease
MLIGPMVVILNGIVAVDAKFDRRATIKLLVAFAGLLLAILPQQNTSLQALWEISADLFKSLFGTFVSALYTVTISKYQLQFDISPAILLRQYMPMSCVLLLASCLFIDVRPAIVDGSPRLWGLIGLVRRYSSNPLLFS